MENLPEQDLFIFELANNHQGDVEHAKLIIEKMASIAKKYKVQASIKFQLRDLATFIHPMAVKSGSNKHISRFTSTALSLEQFGELVQFVKVHGLYTMASVFDERSIESFLDLNIDLLKVASCSATDYPLLRGLKKLNHATILSTASLEQNEIERAIYCLGKKQAQLAIMHCVGLYPTENQDLLLSRIEKIKHWFPGHKVGYSTHEHPNEFRPIQMAKALGCQIFEKHVGLETPAYKLNKYSASPLQVEQWIQSYLEGCSFIKNKEEDYHRVHDCERNQLSGLQRGIYSKRNINLGEKLGPENTALAFPVNPGQATSKTYWSESIYARTAHSNESVIQEKGIEERESSHLDDLLIFYTRLTHHAGLVIPENTQAEISIHQGVDQVTELGSLIITMINQEICQKYILLAQGQGHPSHCHDDRVEFIKLLYGDSQLSRADETIELSPHVFYRVNKDCFHSFKSNSGAVLEELTTTYSPGKSHYQNPENKRGQVKVVWENSRWIC